MLARDEAQESFVAHFRIRAEFWVVSQRIRHRVPAGFADQNWYETSVVAELSVIQFLGNVL